MKNFINLWYHRRICIAKEPAAKPFGEAIPQLEALKPTRNTALQLLYFRFSTFIKPAFPVQHFKHLRTELDATSLVTQADIRGTPACQAFTNGEADGVAGRSTSYERLVQRCNTWRLHVGAPKVKQESSLNSKCRNMAFTCNAHGKGSIYTRKPLWMSKWKLNRA